MDISGGSDAFGIEGFISGGNHSWNQAFFGRVYGGGCSHNYGLNTAVTAGDGSYNYGVYASAIGGSGGFSTAGYFNGKLHYGTLHAISDRKFKKNVRDFQDGLGKIMALKPKRYEMRRGEFDGHVDLAEGKHIGLIAQEVEMIMPELVSVAYAPVSIDKEEKTSRTRKELLEYKSLDYTGIIPVLIKGMQEQQLQIQELKTELERLKR